MKYLKHNHKLKNDNKKREKLKLKKGIIFILIIILISIVLVFINKCMVHNLSGVYSYEGIDDTELDNNLKNIDDTSGIITSYDEYLNFVNKYDIPNEIKKDNFDKNDYIYYLLIDMFCKDHNVFGVNKLEFSGDTVNIVFNVGEHCILPFYALYFIPIDKGSGNKITNITSSENVVYKRKKSGFAKEYEIDYKPILYLYPTYDVDINVKLDREELLKTTYPKYKDGWEIRANSNGDLYDKDGKYYYALYWDEVNVNDVDFSYGFYVTKDNASSFLEEKLSIIGLNDRERNEFIMYWLPKLEDNGKSLVYFELTEEREKNNKLIIEPQPDSLLRINMHIKKVNKKVNIKEQKLYGFERNGFVAVEWGGTIHK